jgi:hypothetical protein
MLTFAAIPIRHHTRSSTQRHLHVNQVESPRHLAALASSIVMGGTIMAPGEIFYQA